LSVEEGAYSVGFHTFAAGSNHPGEFEEAKSSLFPAFNIGTANLRSSGTATLGLEDDDVHKYAQKSQTPLSLDMVSNMSGKGSQVVDSNINMAL
jgi:hypothetical protein